MTTNNKETYDINDEKLKNIKNYFSQVANCNNKDPKKRLFEDTAKRNFCELLKLYSLEPNEQNMRLTKIGNATQQPEFYFNPNKEKLVWTTLIAQNLNTNFWWLCYSIGTGIYLFELSQEEHFVREDFGTINITKERNKKKTDAYKQFDIVLDTTNEAFNELLPDSKHKDFKKYLRAKLDFKESKLHIYSKNKQISQDDYEKRRQEKLNTLNKEQTAAAETELKAALVVAGAGCGKTRTLLGRIIHLYEEQKIESADDILMVVFNKKNQNELAAELEKLGYNPQSAHTFHSLGLRICKELIDSNTRSIDPEWDPLDLVLRLFELTNYDTQDREANKLYNSYDRLFYNTLTSIAKTVQNYKNRIDWHNKLYQWGKIKGNAPEKSTVEMYEKYKNGDIIAWFDENDFSLDTNNYWFTDDNKCKLRILNYLILNGYAEDIIVNRSEKYITIKSNNNIKLYWEKCNSENIFKELETKIPTRQLLSSENLDDKISTMILRAYSYKFRQIAKLFISLCKIYRKTDFDKIKTILLESIISELKGLKDAFSYATSAAARYSLESQLLRLTMQKEHIEYFFDLIDPVYNVYKDFLKKESCIDFNDMINYATDALNDPKNKNDKFKYKYILVDEFQDISYDTFQLIKSLKERSNASIMCVGDDWQSIYSWRGSDLKFFNKFADNFKLSSKDFDKFKLQHTYRYGQNLADVSGQFIMKKNTEIEYEEKHLVSAGKYKNTDIKIFDSAQEWEGLLSDIEKYRTENEDLSVKILLRYNKDTKDILGREKDTLEQELKQRFPGEHTGITTIHKAKGLEADVVVILNLIRGKFPSEIRSDIVLQYFEEKDQGDDEERRLMYVAMTRAKKACYLWNPPKEKKSPFLTEIEEILK